jgi:alpha-tubulin suppressor-like RCC1 family protein
MGTGGTAYTSNLNVPTLMTHLDLRFESVSCGRSHLVAIDKNGRVLTWGNPDSGKLGHKPKEVDQKIKKTRDFRPRNYADHAEMDFALGDIENKRII